LNHWKTVSSTSYALTGFVAWTLLLLLLMEGIRTFLVLTGRVAANGFTPENEGLSPFMQRFARAHANCIEGLPIFGGLLAIAIMTSRTAITDPLAFGLLGALILQSIVHLISTSSIAVSARFLVYSLCRWQSASIGAGSCSCDDDGIDQAR
jgi:uncharacterized MAPEG superfamily protein